MERRNSEMNTHHEWLCPFIEDPRDAFEVGVGEDGKTRISIDIPEGCFMEVSTGIGPDGCLRLQMETDAPVKAMMHELLCNLMILNMEE